MINKETLSKYQTTIGIETHVQLSTQTKIFCRCANDSRDSEPNANICPICLGLPGALPYLNKAAVESAIQVGLALNGKIAGKTKFDRKHYFYPDLPKGYQISQYDEPIVGEGSVTVPFDEGEFKVGIVRAHLEEDAGKSSHPTGADYSLVDLNRAGTPLMEIVSKPDIKSPARAKAFVKELYLIMLHSGVSDVDLYQGNMRFDVNISVATKGAKELGLRTEVKNLNSFRSVEKACEYELKRQVEELESGRKPTQSTRGWDEAKGKTYEMRTKEGESDYRYFPEPDLPPLVISSQLIESLEKKMPHMPAAIRHDLAKSGISTKQADALLSEPRLLALYLEADKGAKGENVKHIANWLVRDVQSVTSKSDFDWPKFTLSADSLIKLSTMVTDGKLSSNGAERVLQILIQGGDDPTKLAEKENLLQVSDTDEMEKVVDEVIKANPEAAKDYQTGNERSLQFLIGQVMRASAGRANPQLATKLIKERLDR